MLTRYSLLLATIFVGFLIILSAAVRGAGRLLRRHWLVAALGSALVLPLRTAVDLNPTVAGQDSPSKLS